MAVMKLYLLPKLTEAFSLGALFTVVDQAIYTAR
jgi:hypothetical protein